MLSTIGKEGASPSPALPPTGVQSQKRKAEGGLTSPNRKVSKADTTSRPSPAPSIRHLMDERKSLGTKGSPIQAVPYRGTSQPINSYPPSQTLNSDPSKQPKKGSYKEIMARAQAAAAQPKASVGIINHKPKDQMEISYKKELKMKKKALRDKKLGIVKDNSRPSSSDGNISSSAPGRFVNGKKAPQPSYSGTAKPNKPAKQQPSYKGTMNPGAVARKSEKPKRRANEYAATDDELEDYEEEENEEGDGYGNSEGESDDMEAGFSDVEQEESAATKAAKKEDEEEAKLEARLKREKEERRRRLEGLAKKAKPQRY